METLNPNIIVAGEKLLREENVIEFGQFIRKNVLAIDHDQVIEHVQKMVDSGQVDRAIRLWYHVTDDHNPTKELLTLISYYARRMFWYSGALAGWVALLWLLVSTLRSDRN